MTSTASNPTSRVDDLIHREQSAIACPYPIFADLRSGGGVAWVESLGAWMITRYDDVRSIADVYHPR